MPSRRPVKPSPSSVVALTLTQSLGGNRGVDIDYVPAPSADSAHDLAQKLKAVCALVFFVTVREQAAYIPHGRRAEQGVAYAVEQNIGIRMAEQPHGMRYINAADYELSPLDELMNVISAAYFSV